ncbi:MAG: ABC transporter ATP-binding protein [Chloroflexi bacterium]|nr:ABC transporter ATP-binding protein [Chloroflexota bacterium]
MDGGIELEAVGLGFVYPDGTRALDGIDLRVAAGESVAIVGQNGSGKSTFVRHLNGLLRATGGRVIVGGTDVGRRHVAELARLVGVVFQNPDRQIFAGRVRAEVAFGARNVGLRGSALDSRVDAALERVGLTGHATDNPYDLGHSKRKLLATASILAMETPAVVLDEPTTGQDLAGIAQMRTIVAELTATGRTVVAISHDMRFVAETFPRVVVMQAGRVVLDGPPARVFAEVSWPILAATYLEAPLAAHVGAAAGLGSTPTEDALIEALVARAGGAAGAATTPPG